MIAYATRLLLIASTSALLLSACAAGTPTSTPTPDPAAAVEAARVVTDGRVLPTRDADLRFELPGTVAELLVAEGDTVAAGAPLARLDTASLEAAVEQARATLDEASAQLELLQAGARPEAVAAAEAQVAQAQAAARQTGGRVTAADLQAARDALREAQAVLARLQAGPKGTEIEQARAALAQAQANLQTGRDALSGAKTTADLRVTQAANALRDAQDASSQIYWANVELGKLGDLPQARKDAEAAAHRAVADAEAALAQAKVALDNARQAELTGLAAATAQTRDAQARLDQVLAGTDADQLAAAQARVSAAQAHIAQLTGTARAGELAAAQAGVSQAQAGLAQVAAAPRSPEVAAAAARVRVGQAALRQAELTLAKATLTAPFAGTVVEVNLTVGEQPTAASPAFVLADLSNWRIETSDLTELDVVSVREGDPATISFDALPDLSLTGTVTKIQALGKTFQGDVIYTVTVAPQSWDKRLRWNMTATVTFGPA
ncbi:MAG: efflux RND transporter periplasmic adaptor subunit [Chloroflexales bacterium]